MHQWVTWDKQPHRYFLLSLGSIDFGYDRVQHERQTSWINDLERDLQWVGGIYSGNVPVLQVYPLPLRIFLQLDASLRCLRRAQSSLGGISGSRFSSSSGLQINCADTQQRHANPGDGEYEVGPIQRVISGIVGVGLLTLSVWFLYVGAPNAFFDNSATVTFLNRDARAGVHFLLFVVCFCLSVPFADTGFCGTNVWICLLLNGCK